MKKDNNLTKQQIKIFRGGNKPDQQAMDVYKSKTNEAKTSLTSRLRTATKQKSKRRRTKPDQQATNSKATTTNEEGTDPTSGLRTAKQQTQTKRQPPAAAKPHHSDQCQAPTPLSPPSKPPPQSPHRRGPSPPSPQTPPSSARSPVPQGPGAASCPAWAWARWAAGR